MYGIFEAIGLCEEPAVVRLPHEVFKVGFVLSNQHVFGQGGERAVVLKFLTPVIVFCRLGKDLYDQRGIQQGVFLFVIKLRLITYHNDIWIGVEPSGFKVSITY